MPTRATMTASARKSPAVGQHADQPLLVQAGRISPRRLSAARCVLRADEDGEEDAGDRPAGDESRAEQRAGAQIGRACDSPVDRSTHQRTSPPAKIGAVVAIGR